jgi:crotonobetainyl-CoA:carnitine CoA-transferase CaiB-like acyl-CoA transferase
MTAVLDGVKVLEVAEQGFVPSAAAVLADWGADVVKVERPQGDALREVMPAGLVVNTGDVNFLVEQFNRNKRNVCIDLKHPEGRALLDELIRWADVFITNQLPQVLRKLRLTPADVFAANAHLVYARGHGQGVRGPDAEMGGYDSVSFWSRAGIGHMLSGETITMQRGAMGDGPSGMFLAGGIAAALFARERTGRGIIVDVSLLAGGIWTLSPDLVSTSILGENPPKGTARPASGMLLTGNYRTSDARILTLNMMATDKYWQAACEALELPELGSDPALHSDAGRAARAAEVRQRLAASIAAKPIEYWEKRLRERGCIYAKFATPLEVLSDPQVESNGYMPRLPGHARARLASSPVQFDEQPISVRRPAPGRGEHTDEVLEALGIDRARRAKLRAAGAIA